MDHTELVNELKAEGLPPLVAEWFADLDVDNPITLLVAAVLASHMDSDGSVTISFEQITDEANDILDSLREC